MNIRKYQLGHVTVAKVAGQLDYNSYLDFQNDIFDMIDGGSWNVAIDLEETTFMDSAGLLAFIRINRWLQGKGGKLVVFNVSSMIISWLFEFSGIARVIHVVKSKQDAIEALGQAVSQRRINGSNLEALALSGHSAETERVPHA